MPSTHGGINHAELEELGIAAEEVLDFSANLNPFGPPQAVVESLSQADIDHYPDSEATHLRRVLAEALGLATSNILVGNGATELIRLAALAYFNATLTLPGIAGIILTVGVGVDTNVLVFERIREELRNGKTVRVAIQNGFDRVWIIIFDTHLTGLIAAAFLFQFGTGPIKGFAVTLVIGLVANVFASFFISKFLFEWVLGKRHVESLSI